MCHMIISLGLLIIAFSKAEEFLKCSAVGKSNEKCVKDFYPDQEAQESNYFSPYDEEHHYQDYQGEPQFPQEFNAKSSYYSDQDQFLNGQQYTYGYSVSDETTGDQKFHRESRQDNVVHGTYSLIEPDGSKRTVVYTADDVHGFKAVVYRNQATSDDHLYDSEGYNNAHIHAAESARHNTEPRSYSSYEQPGLVDFINQNHQNYEAQNTRPNPSNYEAQDTRTNPSNYEAQDTRTNPSNYEAQDTRTNPSSAPYQPSGLHQESTNFPVTSHDSNVVTTILDHNFSSQISQNIPILVDSSQTSSLPPPAYGSELQNYNPEILNELGGILGEQNFVDSLIREVEYPNIHHSEQDRNLNSQVSSPTPNSIRAQLSREIVRNHNSQLASESRVTITNSVGTQLDGEGVSISPNSIQGVASIINPTLESTTIAISGNTPQKIVTDGALSGRQSNADVHPTFYSPLDLNTHISSHFVDSSVFNTSAVVERPHVIVTTPVPITTKMSPLRLNTLENGEFPLLAHISPTYSRRYARQYA